MLSPALRVVAACIFCLGVAANAAMPSAEYLDGKDSKVGVILAHGRGGGADSNVVGPLRRAIHRELGFHTLSLNMPLPEAGKPIDTSTFSEAYDRIRSGIDFLKKEKGVARVYLVGYSMGGRTTTAFIANHADHDIAGFVGIGLLGGGASPFNANANLRKVTIPVLDVFAENEPSDAKAAAFRKAMVSERFQQIGIGAPHSFKGYDSHIAKAAVRWLKAQESAGTPSAK